MQFGQGLTLRHPPQMKTLRAGDIGVAERFALPERESLGQAGSRTGGCREVAKCRGINREPFTGDAYAVWRGSQPRTKQNPELAQAPPQFPPRIGNIIPE